MNDRDLARGRGWITPQSQHWPSSARALTTTRDGTPGGEHSEGPFARMNLAAHVGDALQAVTANRQALEAATGVEHIQWLNQVHGARCIEASRQTSAMLPDADAAWTCTRGLALAVLTADCVPVVLTDRSGSLIAVAHAGWRGLVAGVLANLLQALPEDPSRLVAWLGPAIGPGAYEVGEEVVDAIAALPDGARLTRNCAVAAAAGKHRVDLFELSEQLLHLAGVPLVLSERFCTWSDDRFYSYRRDGTTGRMATLAWIP
jgi:polyphenol oxidase